MKMTPAIIAAATLILAAQAQAQQTMIEIESDNQMVAPFNMTVDAVEDMDVFDAAGNEIGEVEEVLGSSDGTPMALAVEAGGFLGIGDRDVIVPLDAFTLANGRLSVGMTKEQIEALPVWDD